VDRLFDISLGQGHQLLKSLQDAGLSAPQAVKLIKEPETARRLVTTFFYPWSVSMPLWWRTPEEQITRARKTWGEEIEIPEIPADFKPRTSTEVLLLHTPSTVKKMWQAIPGPSGFRKDGGWPWIYDLEFNLLPGVLHHEKPVWVGFDPDFVLDKDPKHQKPPTRKIPSGCNLAASEVMSAALQFTGWILTWGKWDEVRRSHYHPDMAGYTLDHGDHDYGKTSIIAIGTSDYPVNKLSLSIIPASLGENAALVRKL
jgi:hypothetical protein